MLTANSKCTDILAQTVIIQFHAAISSAISHYSMPAAEAHTAVWDTCVSLQQYHTRTAQHTGWTLFIIWLYGQPWFKELQTCVGTETADWSITRRWSYGAQPPCGLTHFVLFEGNDCVTSMVILSASFMCRSEIFCKSPTTLWGCNCNVRHPNVLCAKCPRDWERGKIKSLGIKCQSV